jgi:hypothetical protein
MKTLLAVSTACTVGLLALSIGTTEAGPSSTGDDIYLNFCGGQELPCQPGSNLSMDLSRSALPYSPLTISGKRESYSSRNIKGLTYGVDSFNKRVYGEFCGSTRIPC